MRYNITHLLVDFMPLYYKYFFLLRNDKIKRLSAVIDNTTVDTTYLYYITKELEGIPSELGLDRNSVKISICFDSKHNIRKEIDKDYKGTRDKVLTQEDFDTIDSLYNIYSKIYIPILPQSTVIIEKRANGEEYIDSYIGVESIIGEKHILREKEKGIFIQRKEIQNFDFFRIEKSYPLLCTENVKKYIEKRGFSNVVFLEVGDVIEN